jgi:hypothetical protein
MTLGVELLPRCICAPAVGGVDEAPKSIDTGIALLVGTSDLSIHQDFVRERVMIEAMRDMSRRHDAVRRT